MNSRTALNSAKFECDEQFRHADARRSIGLITDFQWLIDMMIALQNFRIQAVRIKHPEVQDHSADLNAITMEAYKPISDTFPSVIPNVSSKAFFRDWKVFDVISKAFLDEHGWNDFRTRVRVVPREWRTRTWRERFEHHDELEYSASLKEVMQFHASLPEYGSFKTIERQYAAAKRQIASYVYADPERGLVMRDPFYEQRLLHLNMMNVDVMNIDLSKIEGPETV